MVEREVCLQVVCLVKGAVCQMGTIVVCLVERVSLHPAEIVCLVEREQEQELPEGPCVWLEWAREESRHQESSAPLVQSERRQWTTAERSEVIRSSGQLSN